MGISLRR